MSNPVVPYTRRGVYVNDSGAPTILSSGLTGGILAVIGTAPKGSSAVGAVVYTNAQDVFKDYGDPATYPQWTIPRAAAAYFNQSGKGQGLRPGMVVERIGATLATATLAGSTASLVVTAKPAYAGSAGNAVSVVIAAVVGNTQLVTVSVGNVVETYTITDATHQATQLASLLTQGSQLVTPGAATDGSFFTVGTTTLATGVDGLGTAIAQAHFDALLSVQGIDGVAPLDGLQATALLAQAHVDTASASYAKPRVAFLGTVQITAADHVTPITTSVTALADQAGRVVYAGNDGVLVPSPTNPAVLQAMDGWVLAVMLAGSKFANAPAQGLTGAPIYGCAGPATPLTDSQQNTLTQNGATVLTNEYGGWTVLQGVTTAPGNSAFFNIGLREAEDELAKRLQRYFTQQFIGKPETADSPGLLAGGCNQVCQAAIKDGVIVAVGQIPTPSRVSAGNWSLAIPYYPRWEMDVLTINLSTITQ